MLRAFRLLPNCGVGGPLHIIVDDENVRDDDLAFCRAAVKERDHWSFQANDPAVADEIARHALAILDVLTPMSKAARLRWVRAQNRHAGPPIQ